MTDILDSASPLRRAPAPAPERGWRALSKSLCDGGRLVRPGEADYGRHSAGCNKRYAGTSPEGVALCRGVGDVAAALRWAQDEGMPFAVRSGGHSYAGFSDSSGLVIDVAGLSTVDVGADRVRVGPGVLQQRLHGALRDSGRTVPVGRCPTVAMGGLVLGGGIGFTARHHGLTCDVLVETEVLTASGELLRCSPDQHADLFWACRGGGGGNFGINTSFTLATVPVSVTSLFELTWDIEQAQPVMAAAQQVLAGGPDELGMRIDVSTAGEHPAKVAAQATVTVIGQLAGSQQRLLAILAPMLAIPGLRKRSVRECDHWTAVDTFAELLPIHHFAVKSLMVPSVLPPDAVELLVSELLRWPGSANEDGAVLALFAIGGAIGRVAHDATAFAHRGAAQILALETNWLDEEAHLADVHVDWLDRLYQRVRPYVSDGAYPNFPDRDLPHWRRAYYGTNDERLVEVKRRYDPAGAFRFEQSVGS